MELKYSLLVVLLLLGNKIERSSAEEDDDDHHHDEEKCGVTVDPFMEIKEAINVTQDELGSTALEHLVEHVLERFDCEEATCQVGHFFIPIAFIHGCQINLFESNIPEKNLEL